MNVIDAVIHVFTLCNSHKNMVRLINTFNLGREFNFECFHWKYRMESSVHNH